MEGVKYDGGKLRWNLLPWNALAEVVKVLMWGSAKYEDHNWMRVPNARERYKDALLRHVVQGYMSGDIADEETKLHHLAHAICCCLFIIWFDIKDGLYTIFNPDFKAVKEKYKCTKSQST